MTCEYKYYNEYVTTGFFKRDHSYHTLIGFKGLIALLSCIYILKQTEKYSRLGDNQLIRHQNFIGVSTFYIFAFFIIMTVGISAIQKHAVHDILYNTLPMIYVVDLLFIFSVSPSGTTFYPRRQTTKAEEMTGLPSRYIF